MLDDFTLLRLWDCNLCAYNNEVAKMKQAKSETVEQKLHEGGKNGTTPTHPGPLKATMGATQARAVSLAVTGLPLESRAKREGRGTSSHPKQSKSRARPWR